MGIQIVQQPIIAPLEQTEWTNYFELLPEQERTKIQAFKRWQDKTASLAGKKLLIDYLISRKIPVTGELPLTYNSQKRAELPYGFSFNVSHCDGMVVLAISDDAVVGVDIEKLNPVEIHDFRNCFTTEEWTLIVGDEQPLYRFYYYWTRKEAVLKAIGSGLQISPSGLDVRTETVRVSEWVVDVYPYDPGAGYVAHYALLRGGGYFS